jgi:hypothetical protein
MVRGQGPLRSPAVSWSAFPWVIQLVCQPTLQRSVQIEPFSFAKAAPSARYRIYPEQIASSSEAPFSTIQQCEYRAEIIQ